MKQKLVYGVGVYDGGNESTSIAYDTWHRMMERCYSDKHMKNFPSYIGCTVDNQWLRYSIFSEWFSSNYVEGYHLDKDIIIQGNRIYSSETCVFIPHHINQLLTDRARDRGEFPLGVSKEARRNKYKAGISINGKNKHLGFYDTPELAHEAWRIAKKKYVSECANEAYAKGEISERVRDALLNRKFE
jgi:hypothetical protein